MAKNNAKIYEIDDGIINFTCNDFFDLDET